MRFSLKLFTIILETAVLPLLLVGYIAYFNIKQEITQNILGRLDVIAQIQKNRLQSNINDEKDLLNLFTAKSQLRLLFDRFNNNHSEATRKEMINNISESKEDTIAIKNILLANTEGIIVAATEPDFIGGDISDEEFFKKGIKQDDVSFIEKDPETGQIYQYFVGPITYNNKIVGMGIIITDNNDIISLVSDYSGLGDTGEIVLVKNDGNGNALFIAPTRFDKETAFNRVVPKDKPNMAVINAINGKEGTFSNVVNYRDKSVFAVTRYVDSVGWGIVVEMEKSEALLPLKRLQRLFLFILFVVITLIIIIVIPVSISITKPIKKLIFLSQKIAEGDLSQSLQIKSKDEIGELSYFLNQMLVSLKKVTEKFKNLSSNLKKEVKEQTSKLKEQNISLSDANKAMINLTEDLEEEKNELEVAKTHNEAIITGIGDALIATNSNGIINLVNPVAEKMFGYSSSEALGKSVYDLLPLEDEEENRVAKQDRPIFAAIFQKKIVSSINYCIRKDKTKFITAITSAPIILNNKVIGAVDIFRDVTKEREIDRIKTEFVSLASHQLRTPATAVKWYSEMLLDKKTGELNKNQWRYLNEVYYGNERMIRLINNLLSISRIELGKISVQNEIIDAKNFFNDVIKDQKMEISKRNHKVTLRQFGGSIKIMTDPILLRMILQNFLSNAVKYTLNNGKINCAVKKSNDKILFSVADNGVGIPKNEQGRIFEKLFRASNSLEMDREGNGLGLYIVKQVASTLGGKIWFESEENKGTTFYFELPIKDNINEKSKFDTKKSA